ncbi:MAG: FISUMP domain-containing protein [bacterium]
MKKTLLLLSVFFCALSLYAIDPIVKFYLNDGSQAKEYKIANIGNIGFIKGQNAGLMRIFTKDSLQSKFYISDIDSIIIVDLFGEPGILRVYSSLEISNLKLMDIDSVVFYASDARIINGWVTDLIINRDQLIVSSFNDFNRKIGIDGDFIIRIPNNNLPQIIFLKNQQDSAIGASIIKTTDLVCNINSKSTASVIIFLNTMMAGVSLDSMKDNVVDFINNLGETSWIANRIEQFQNEGLSYTNTMDDTLKPVLEMAVSKVYEFITGKKPEILRKINKINKNFDVLLNDLKVLPIEESGIKVEANSNQDGFVQVKITNNRKRHINIRTNALPGEVFQVGPLKANSSLLGSLLDEQFENPKILNIKISNGFTIEACGPAFGYNIIGYDHNDNFYLDPYFRTVASMAMPAIDCIISGYFGKLDPKNMELYQEIIDFIYTNSNRILAKSEIQEKLAKNDIPGACLETAKLITTDKELIEVIAKVFSISISEEVINRIVAFSTALCNSLDFLGIYFDLWWINEYSTFFVLPDVTKDLEKPIIKINSIVPNNNKVAPLNYVNISTTLSDNLKLSKAHLYVDNDNNTKPYQTEDLLDQNIKTKDIQFNWMANKILGYHKLRLTVYDEYGNRTDETINIEVTNSPNDITKPTVELTAPTETTIPQGSNVTAKIHLTDDSSIQFWKISVENQTTKKNETIAKETLSNAQKDITREILVNTSKYPVGTVLRFYIAAGDGNFNQTTITKDFTVTNNQIPTQGLVAYYPFNGNANDESGNGQNGIVNGASLVKDRFGQDNKAYSFNGVTNNIEIKNSSSLQLTSAFTMSFWVNINNWWGGEWAPFLFKGDKIKSPIYGIATHKTDGWNLVINTTNNVSKPKLATLNSKKWYHIAWVWDGNNSSLYIDNKKYILNNYQGSQTNNSGSLYFGYAANPSAGVWYNGLMDDIRIYNNALSDSEISALYNENSSIIPNYESVVIGAQEWMKKNLDVSTYRNGDPIPQVTDPTAWANLTTGAWCYYNNDPNNATTYGKLYNWYAVIDPRGLAPMGWHIPTNSEFNNLSNFLGGDNAAGGKMKESGNSHWKSPNTGATNTSGFTGLPGGYRIYDGKFDLIGYFGSWWSATELNATNGNARSLNYNQNGVASSGGANKKDGNSVRCIKD